MNHRKLTVWGLVAFFFIYTVNAQCTEFDYQVDVNGNILSCFDGEWIEGGMVEDRSIIGKCYGNLDLRSYPHTLNDLSGSWWFNITNLRDNTEVLDVCFQTNMAFKGTPYNILADNSEVDISGLFTKYNRNGFDFYCIKDVSFAPSQLRRMRLFYRVSDVRMGLNFGKINVWVKRSNDTLNEMRSSGRYCMMDPWYNVTWDQCKNITLSNPDAYTHTNEIHGHYQDLNLTGLDFAGGNCSHIRLVSNHCDLGGSDTVKWEIQSEGSDWCVIKIFQTVPASGSANLSVYFRNNTVVDSAPNTYFGRYTTTQETFEDCSTFPVCDNTWIGSTGNYEVVNGELHMTSGAGEIEHQYPVDCINSGFSPCSYANGTATSQYSVFMDVRANIQTGSSIQWNFYSDGGANHYLTWNSTHTGGKSHLGSWNYSTVIGGLSVANQTYLIGTQGGKYIDPFYPEIDNFDGTYIDNPSPAFNGDWDGEYQLSSSEYYIDDIITYNNPNVEKYVNESSVTLGALESYTTSTTSTSTTTSTTSTSTTSTIPPTTSSAYPTTTIDTSIPIQNPYMSIQSVDVKDNVSDDVEEIMLPIRASINGFIGVLPLIIRLILYAIPLFVVMFTIGLAHKTIRKVFGGALR